MAEELAAMNTDQKLKLTTYYAVSKTCDELGKDNTLLGPFTVSKDAKELITEFIMNKMELYAEDLEAFASHARRNLINGDDVKLLFRRNPKLLEELDKLDEEEKLAKAEKSKKRKRTVEEAIEDEDE
ncbi:centromere protein S-like [Rhodnius prolixus]|uniref:Centromere protein S n=1 Tax=Rhodnius prolixus TaxID=13249 RepID=T1HS81_RHOPR